MHSFLRGLPIGILGYLAFAAPAGAQSAAATVTFEVQAISEMSLSGSPAALTISAATPGDPPTPAVDQSTTWAITTNEAGRKVTAAIDPLPEGVNLSVLLAAPPGATGLGAVQLEASARDVVIDIPAVQASGLPITYSLSASAAAGVVPSATTVVTYTITAGA
jgi:hypothetical protein